MMGFDKLPPVGSEESPPRLIRPFCAVGRPISHYTATIFKHVVIRRTHTCNTQTPPSPQSAQLLPCESQPHPGELPLAALEKPTQHEYWKSFSTCTSVSACVCVGGGWGLLQGLRRDLEHSEDNNMHHTSCLNSKIYKDLSVNLQPAGGEKRTCM